MMIFFTKPSEKASAWIMIYENFNTAAKTTCTCCLLHICIYIIMYQKEIAFTFRPPTRVSIQFHLTCTNFHTDLQQIQHKKLYLFLSSWTSQDGKQLRLVQQNPGSPQMLLVPGALGPQVLLLQCISSIIAVLKVPQ
jgi:hypothetical protein